MEAARLVGEVIFFDPGKGYGFIKQAEEGRQDMFVHWTNIVCSGFKTLHKGQKVEYSIGEGDRANHKGVQAVEVVVIEDSRE
jgi:CspA family cold shock protein